MSRPDDSVIDIRGLTKRFGAFIAVDNLSFSVERGEIFGLLGPNGSGKTTTINVISGLSRPTSGRVIVLGYDIAENPRAVRAALGAVPQETALYEELTAWHNLAFHAEIYGVPSKERYRRIEDLLSLVQLSDRRNSRVGTFSGGMKRRLALARSLLHDPRLLYFDEPTLGVDVQSRRALWDYILALKDRGKTTLITTNYLEEASVLCDRLAIIDHGRLLALDTPDTLKRRFGATILEITTEPPPADAVLERLRRIDGVAEVSVDDGALKVSIDGQHLATGAVVTALSQSVEIRSITQREPNLEDVFLKLTGSALRD